MNTSSPKQRCGVPTRREFFGLAAVLTPLASCALAPAAVVSRRSPAHSMVQAAAQTTALRTSSPSPADWNALARGLSGHLVRPGEAAYATSRRLFDPRFDSMRPAGIAYVHNPHDVAACLAFARRYHIPVAARSGGHSYAGWSSNNGGLVIDVTKLNAVAVHGATATVGAGTRLIDLYNGLAAHGRAIPAGSCPTVGVAGLTLGGGVGVLSRAYGLTCDALESVQVVTADGAVRACDSREHSDLFWACRGGGGGNFGVATSFGFRTHPAPRIIVFTLSWPWTRAARVVAAWQSWAPHAPDALWSNLHLGRAAGGGGTPSVQVGGTYLGSVTGLEKLLGHLYARVGSDPAGHFVGQPRSYLHVMLVEAGCASESVQACHLPWVAPGGQLGRVPQYAKSDFFTRPLSGAGIATLLHGVEKLRHVSGAAGGGGGVALDALGGAVNRVAPGATAFVHRDALFDAQYTTNWDAGPGGAGAARQLAWLRSFWASMRPYASGQCYQNYIDPDLVGWRQAYYGANYGRLSAIKAKYDPGRLFRFPQGV